MAVTIDRVAPVAHLPLVLGVLRKLGIAELVEAMIPPHPDQIVSAGRAVEALVLAILDGHHALYKVGRRLHWGVQKYLPEDIFRARDLDLMRPASLPQYLGQLMGFSA